MTPKLHPSTVPSVLIEYQGLRSTDQYAMVITGWWNGEGVDVVITRDDNEPEQRFELHIDDIDALVNGLKSIGFYSE
jgi:hypothetical protein